jgi:hypothetical protein
VNADAIHVPDKNDVPSTELRGLCGRNYDVVPFAQIGLHAGAFDAKSNTVSAAQQSGAQVGKQLRIPSDLDLMRGHDE